jgi:hypothetical protein
MKRYFKLYQVVEWHGESATIIWNNGKYNDEFVLIIGSTYNKEYLSKLHKQCNDDTLGHEDYIVYCDREELLEQNDW